MPAAPRFADAEKPLPMVGALPLCLALVIHPPHAFVRRAAPHPGNPHRPRQRVLPASIPLPHPIPIPPPIGRRPINTP